MDFKLEIYDPEKCILFALGSNAIYAACRAFGLKPQDEVLTPAFDCDVALHPFKVSGCRLKFFRSDPYTFNADIDDIKRKITPKTKLMHIINHFGMPQDWDRLLALRQEVGIPILEDNAYSLFSKSGNRAFGTFGDISIFSLWKHLALMDGGMLRINNQKYKLELPVLSRIPFFYTVDIPRLLYLIRVKLHHYKYPYIIRDIIAKFMPYIQLEPPPLYSEDRNGYPDWPFRDKLRREFSYNFLRPMSQFSKILLSRLSVEDYRDIVARKRNCYGWFSEKLKDIRGIKVLWPSLQDGVVPFCLSILVESKRDIFLSFLKKKYDVMAWPTLPGLILRQLKEFPEVELLGRKLLQINLSADRIRLRTFRKCSENLVRDIQDLSRKYL